MKHEEFDGGYLDLREPHEVTNAGRRAVRAMMASVSGPMDVFMRAKKAAIDKLDLADGTEPTQEQLDEISTAVTLAMTFDEDTWDRMQQLFDASLVAAIAGWSLDKPVSRATLNEMALGDYDRVAQAGRPYAEAINENLSVDFSVNDPNPRSADPTGA